MEGQKLKKDGDDFRQKLNTQQLFEEWKKSVEARPHIVQGRIFNIVSQRTRTGTVLKLQVNFAPETITLAKEVHFLLIMDNVYVSLLHHLGRGGIEFWNKMHSIVARTQRQSYEDLTGL